MDMQHCYNLWKKTHLQHPTNPRHIIELPKLLLNPQIYFKPILIYWAKYGYATLNIGLSTLFDKICACHTLTTPHDRILDILLNSF